jgi:hypothetical protein
MIRKNKGSYTSYEGRDEVDPQEPNVYQFPIENDFIIIMFSAVSRQPAGNAASHWNGTR